MSACVSGARSRTNKKKIEEQEENKPGVLTVTSGPRYNSGLC